MGGVRSHKDLIAWQRAYELKLQVYDLIRTGSITRDLDLKDQLRSSAAAAPRLMAEGFGRYYPSDFARYLRLANGELKETVESLDDGVDSRHFTREQVLPLQRLARRSSKAATNLIAYLRTAEPPNEPRPRKRRKRFKKRPKPVEPPEQDP